MEKSDSKSRAITPNKDHASGKWEKLRGVLTPGGDPAYICPECRSRESEHVHGIEFSKTWNYCPSCGARLSY